MLQNEKINKLTMEEEWESSYDKEVYIKKENIDWKRDKYIGCLNINGMNGKANV